MNTQKNHYAVLFLALFAVIPVCAVIVPRFLSFSPALAGLVLTGFSYFYYKDKYTFSKPMMVIFSSVIALSALSVFWSVSPDVSLDRLRKLLIVLVPGAFLVNLGLVLDPEKLRKYLWLIPAGILIGCLLTASEISLGAHIYRLTRSMEAAETLNFSVFNRGAVTLTLCLFPALFILQNYIARKWSYALFAFAFAVMFIFSASQSAELASILGLATLIVFPYGRKKAWYALMIVISALIFSAPFIAIWMYQHLAEPINTLPFLGQGGGYASQRMEIWDFISRYILKNPLYGFGIEATQAITDFESAQIYEHTSQVLHPHNATLQFWIEFGIIGAAGAAAFCCFLLRTMQTKLTEAQARIALPTFISCLSVASMSYGFWQSWWLGLLCMVSFFCIIAIRMEKT